jgi:hypothetical protein
MAQEKLHVGGVPLLMSRPVGKRPAPLVLVSHGFTGRKEDFAEKLDELAAKGCLAVAMDNRLHGERAGVGLASLMTDGKVNLSALRRAMAATAADMSIVIDGLCDRGAVDPGKIALVGVSMGGFASFAALVDDPRVAVAAPIISSPYWGDIPADVPVDLATTGAELAAVAENEPATRMGSIPPRPLLMQIGAEDTHYDAARVVRFYEVLRPLYGGASERLRLIVHAGVAHELTDGMWANAVAWVEAHCLGQARTGT